MVRTQGRKKLYRWLRWISGIFFVLILLLAGSGFLLAHFFEKDIKNLFVGEINKRLQSEIKVEDIHLSFFRQFPFATLEFIDLTALDAIPTGPKSVLLHAERLQLHFSLFDLFRKKYRIRRITLKQAQISLKVYNNLSDNFHFWKSDSTQGEENFSFTLEQVSCKNLSLTYQNKASQQDYSLFLKQARGKGAFSKDQFSLKITGEGMVNHMRSSGIDYLQDKPINLNLFMKADHQKSRYDINQGEVVLGNITLTTEGYFIYSDAQKQLALRFSTPGTSLENLMKDLPPHITKPLEAYNPEGSLQLSVSLSGAFGGKHLPLLVVDFSLKDGKIAHKKQGIALEKVNMEGEFTNHASENREDHEWVIRHISAVFGKEPLGATLHIRGIAPAQVALTLTGGMELADLFSFMPSENVQKAKGHFQVRLAFQGMIPVLEKPDIQDFRNGSFTCEATFRDIDLSFKNHHLMYTGMQGSLVCNNNDVLIKQLSGTINDNALSMEGYFRNLIPYLFSEREDLQVDAHITSPSVDLKRLLQNEEGKESAAQLVFPARWNVGLTLGFARCKMGLFQAEKVNAVIQYSAGRLGIQQLSMQTASGVLSGEGFIDGSKGKDFAVSADVMLEGVDISQLFEECGDFGQQHIISKNIRGITHSEIQASFRMDADLVIDPASLVSSLDISIENGALLDYKPIKDLARFIRVEDLSSVTFATLHNTLYIKDKLITIPAMEVVSDAVNFSISGTHTFTHQINYRFQVLLSELLSRKAKKAKKENEEFGIEQSDGSGKTTLYILVTGSVDNPKFRYDSKGVKGKIVANLLNEKHSLKQMLKEEFRRKQKEQDTTRVLEKHLLQQQESGRFVIDWENSLKDSLPPVNTKRQKSRATKNPPDGKQKFKVEWEDDKADPPVK